MQSSVLFLNVAPQAEYGSAKSSHAAPKREYDDRQFDRAVKEANRADSSPKIEESEKVGVLHLRDQNDKYLKVNLSEDQLAQIANMDRVTLVSPEILDQFGGLSNFMEAIRSLIPGTPDLTDGDLAVLSEQISAFNQSQLGAETFPQLIAVNLSPAELSSLSGKVGEESVASGVFALLNQSNNADGVVHVLFVPEDQNMKDILSQFQDFVASLSEEGSLSGEQSTNRVASEQSEIVEEVPAQELLQLLQSAVDNKKDKATFKSLKDVQDMSEDLDALRDLLSRVVDMDGNLGSQTYDFQSLFSGGAPKQLGSLGASVGGNVASFINKSGAGSVPAFLDSLLAKKADLQGGLLPSSNSPVISADILPIDIGSQLFSVSAAPVTNPVSQVNHAHGVLGTQKAGQAHQSTQMVAAMVEKSIGNGGNQKLSVLLNPPELGRVQLDVEINEQSKMKVSVIAEKDSAYTLLQRDSGALEQTLQNAGLDIDSSDIEFSLAGDTSMFDDQNKDNQFDLYANTQDGSQDSGDDQSFGDQEIIETTVDLYRDAYVGHWNYNALV